MKRIAYIELDTHAEIAANFMALTAGNEQFSVDYYFSEKIARQLEISSQNSVFVAKPGEILKKLEQQKKYDLVIIGTAHRYFNIFYKIAVQHNTAVIVHNKNFSRATKINIFLNCFKKDQLYRLKLLCKESLLKSPKLYSITKKLVLAPEMSSENYHFLPLFFRKKFALSTTENGFITVVVPGTVDESRRNYEHIFQESLKFKNPLRLVLLGRPTAEMRRRINLFNKNRPPTVTLVSFDEKIPANEFAVWMCQADVLWCPICDCTEFFSVKEYYGETKMTGNIGDAISFGKIAVFPKNYAKHWNFIKYENTDLEAQFYFLAAEETGDMFLNFEQNSVKFHLLTCLEKLL